MIDTLLIAVGGLGFNQFRHAPSPAMDLPANVHVVFLDDAGYMVGQIPDIIGAIKTAMREYPTIKKVVVIDHSMGWIAGAKAAIEGLVDVLIAADPVGVPGVSKDQWPAPNGKRQAGIFAKARPSMFISQLDVENGPPIVNFNTDHNELVHWPGFIEMCRAEVLS